MDVSQRIKAIRTQKGIKQADIARALGIERTSYHRLENRGEKLTIEQANDIANSLGVTLSDLIAETDSTRGEAPQGTSQLQSRIRELEDRLKDKQFIIDSYDRTKIKLSENLETTMIMMAVGGELASLHLGEYFDPNEDLKDQDRQDQYTYRSYGVKLTQQDFGKIVWELFEANQKYFNLINFLIKENLIDDDKPYVKPFLVYRRLIWPNIESVPTNVRQAMDDMGLTLEDMEKLTDSYNLRSE